MGGDSVETRNKERLRETRMERLSQKELLGILGIRFAGVCSREEAKAYQQIKEMIQKPGVGKEFMKRWKRKLSDAIDSINLYEEMSLEERVKVDLDMVGDERDEQFSKLIPELLKEAGISVAYVIMSTRGGD